MVIVDDGSCIGLCIMFYVLTGIILGFAIIGVIELSDRILKRKNDKQNTKIQ